jgi:Acyl-protein synthetase, LuxE
MNIQDMLTLAPYALSQPEKEEVLIDPLNILTKHHYEHCPSYARILDVFYEGKTFDHTLSSLPFLPVNIFKEERLASIAESEVFKVLLSSGTSGMRPSTILLDRETAQRQTAALANIMISFLGKQRLPMLIIDTPSVIANRKQFHARGAGLIGMSHFGRDHFYALDDHMELNREGLKRWVAAHGGKSILVFGFTYIIWKHLVEMLKPGEIALPNGILFHSGGWKKLEQQKVNNASFKETIRSHLGISRCHSFYGMIEQVGSIFVECEEGHLHCPNFAEIIVRHPINWKEAPIGIRGVIQALSILPTSYPGHSLLTEDWGVMHGIDTCLCGRKGKFFWIDGRVPQTQLRGCSDTYAFHEERE